MTDDQASFVKNSAGRIEIHGVLGAASVAALTPQIPGLIDTPGSVDLDLKMLDHSDSTGLALLLECQRVAAAAGATMRIFNIPEQMLAIARLCSLDEVLPLAAD